MSRLRLPALLAEYQAGNDPARRHWLDRLPEVIAEMAGQWELELDDPFEPGGVCAWVAPARTASGERVVLKVGWLHAEATHEAAGLHFWAGDGAVRLHASQEFGDCVAMLLERCEPGTMLHVLPEPEQDEILCSLLPRLWREPPAGHDFPSLLGMCQRWADEYEEEQGGLDPAAGDSGTGSDRPRLLDPGIEQAGLELFRTLPASTGRQVLLATDMHAQNILAARREPWLAIDPKPHVGDPAYDPLQHMINCDRVVTDPAGLARRFADLLGLDAERLRLWLFARCVQGSPMRPELAEAAARIAP
jgi:streptomycin 6-kinase